MSNKFKINNSSCNCSYDIKNLYTIIDSLFQKNNNLYNIINELHGKIDNLNKNINVIYDTIYCSNDIISISNSTPNDSINENSCITPFNINESYTFITNYKLDDDFNHEIINDDFNDEIINDDFNDY